MRDQSRPNLLKVSGIAAVRPAGSELGLPQDQELTDLGAMSVIDNAALNRRRLGCSVGTRLERDFLIRSDRGWLDPAAGPGRPGRSSCCPYVEESVHACCRDDRPW